jgi:hypothetical protein
MIRRARHLAGGARAVDPDVGVADVLAAGSVVPGIPQPTPVAPADGVGLAHVNCRAFSLASNMMERGSETHGRDATTSADH